MPNYWLLKTEPDCFSIDDLKRDGKTCWEGVRNYQARNFIRDGMKLGDRVLIYHSSSDPIGVAGVAKIVKAGYPDPSARDPKATADDPRWFTVDVAFEKKFKAVVTLTKLKSTPGLENMIVTKASRLSVQPVSRTEFDIVINLGSSKAD